MTDQDLIFEIPKGERNIIKVIGVGGGGSNAVNHMFQQGIRGVDFIVCNTDAQALDMSPVPTKIRLGESLTEGMGAGSKPEVGKNAAIESLDEVKALLENNTTMVFVTAGMGGGTGTGAAPIIAQAAKEMGILTVGIVTIPFGFEGSKRRKQADIGLKEMRESVDTLLVIQNDKLMEMFGNLTLDNAFAQADNVLTTSAKGIAEVISLPGKINVDMNDVKTVMTDRGAALMGAYTAEGEDRAIKAVKGALDSPLLNDNDIKGASHVLLYISHGEDVNMNELSQITDEIQKATGEEAEMIWGTHNDESLGKNIRVTLIATGFSTTEVPPREEKPAVSDTANNVPNEAKPIENTLPNPFGGSSVVEQPVEKEEVQPEPVFNEVVEPAVNTPVNEEVQPELFEPPVEEQRQIFQLEEEEQEEQRFVITNEEPETPAVSTPAVDTQTYRESVDEKMRRMREFSAKIKTPNGLVNMEKEPAYKRMNVELSSVPKSSENPVSRYRLEEVMDEDGNRKYDLKENNSFLHDNVD